MANTSEKVDALCKVRLRMEVVSEAQEKEERFRGPLAYEFVFGVGSGGLSPLEMAIQGKTEGDGMVLDVPEEGWEVFFEHLPVPDPGLLDLQSNERLRLTVEGVVHADQREVVGAMAEAAACDCCGH